MTSPRNRGSRRSKFWFPRNDASIATRESSIASKEPVRFLSKEQSLRVGYTPATREEDLGSMNLDLSRPSQRSLLISRKVYNLHSSREARRAARFGGANQRRVYCHDAHLSAQTL